MDTVIQEMGQRVLDWGHKNVELWTLRKWAAHFRDVVQPQLDELAQLKAERAAKKSAKVGA